jgi:hypothetical protein
VPHIRSQETVESALRASDAGIPDALNAVQHGVAVKTIRRWRRDYQRRSLRRGQTNCAVPCPRCDEARLDLEAYAELLGWYLGDGYLSKGRRGVYALQVFNDARYAHDNEHVLGLMRRVKPGGRPHVRDKVSNVVLTVSWKHWPCLFPQHGPGPKHARPIVLDDWQRTAVESFPAQFLRGRFHSDGSRFANRVRRQVAGETKYYAYPRWQFTNYSAETRELCCWALDLADVPWRQSNQHTISVSTRAGVARLDGLIGMKR